MPLIVSSHLALFLVTKYYKLIIRSGTLYGSIKQFFDGVYKRLVFQSLVLIYVLVGPYIKVDLLLSDTSKSMKLNQCCRYVLVGPYKG